MYKSDVLVFMVLCCVGSTISRPADDLIAGDSELVGSDLRKVYAVAPFEDLAPAATGHEYHKKADDDDVGYYISKSTKGDDGYKHFDSYHKKGGDKYGFETHSAHGKANGGKDGGSHYESGSYDEKDGGGGGKHEELSEEDEGEESRPKKYKKQSKPEKYQGSATEGESFFTSYETGDGYYADDGDDGSYHDGESSGGYDGYDGEYEGGSDDGGEHGGDHGGDHGGEYYGDSEGYYTEGKAAKKPAGVVRSGHPGGATSYYVRHY